MDSSDDTQVRPLPPKLSQLERTYIAWAAIILALVAFLCAAITNCSNCGA